MLDDGDRLMSQADRLRLLMTYLASSAVRARVPVEDLVQETFLRALATGSLPDGDPSPVPRRERRVHLADPLPRPAPGARELPPPPAG